MTTEEMRRSKRAFQYEALKALLTPADAAQYLGGLHVQTLAKWRCQGSGPEYVRLGSRIFYEVSALDVFIADRRRSSTSAA
jgi:hypothetical protein